MEKLLFVHGLASSGSYKLGDILRILLKPVQLLSPDFPIDPDQALSQLRSLVDAERPDVVVGLSWGGFLVQQLRGQRRVVINPDFAISGMLETLVGEVKYLSPRQDGATSFTITPALCARYRELEASQFDGINKAEENLILGFFADHDQVVSCQDIFEAAYPGRSVSYPGTHLPTFPEVKAYIAPEIRRWMGDV